MILRVVAGAGPSILAARGVLAPDGDGVGRAARARHRRPVVVLRDQRMGACAGGRVQHARVCACRALASGVPRRSSPASASAPGRRSGTKSCCSGPGLLLVLWLRTRPSAPLVVGLIGMRAAARRRGGVRGVVVQAAALRRICATPSTCCSRRCASSDAPNPDVPALRRSRCASATRRWSSTGCLAMARSA